MKKILTILAICLTLISCAPTQIIPGQYYRVVAIKMAPKFGCWVWYERLSEVYRIYHKKIPDYKVGDIVRLPDL